VHKNGVTGIATLTIAAPDVLSVRRWWGAALGAQGEAVRRDDLGAAGIRFKVGPHTLDFVAPADAHSVLDAALATRGPAPYALSLKTTGRKGPLDPKRALNARLSLV
jgi:hypothetical protein